MAFFLLDAATCVYLDIIIEGVAFSEAYQQTSFANHKGNEVVLLEFRDDGIIKFLLYFLHHWGRF